MRALIAILLLPTVAFCQGRFTTGDASSMGIGAGLSFGDNTTALSFTLGTSLAGAVDGSVGMILSNVDEDEFGEDIGSTEFGAGLTVRPTQPTPEFPLIVELSVGASHASLHSDTLDDFETDLTGTGWTFGLAVEPTMRRLRSPQIGWKAYPAGLGTSEVGDIVTALRKPPTA